jgi:endonuclease YncB( thermonuclease family)
LGLLQSPAAVDAARMRPLALLALCFVALAAPATASAADGGIVASVTDGDTLRLTDGRRVRLLQVDTPELGGGECYSRAARTQLLQFAGPGTRVRLTTDPRLDRVDRYGRLLAYVTVGRTNVNVELVRRGAATVYFYRGERGVHASTLLAAGRAAQSARRGLWGACPRAVWNPESAAATGSSGPGASATPQPVATRGNCDSSYPDVCIRPYAEVGDLDCPDVPYRSFRVLPPDPHGFDGRDDDGLGCEG